VPSLAVHALTVGAGGGLIIGMMTRTARGHTGRPLQADGFETRLLRPRPRRRARPRRAAAAGARR
jgi:predicted alpha/beta-hydrolase family hydrolase